MKITYEGKSVCVVSWGFLLFVLCIRQTYLYSRDLEELCSQTLEEEKAPGCVNPYTALLRQKPFTVLLGHKAQSDEKLSRNLIVRQVLS